MVTGTCAPSSAVVVTKQERLQQKYTKIWSEHRGLIITTGVTCIVMSPIVAVSGFVYAIFKSLYDIGRLIASHLEAERKDEPFLKQYHINHYSQRIIDNFYHFQTSIWMLIPIFGIVFACFTGALGASVGALATELAQVNHTIRKNISDAVDTQLFPGPGVKEFFVIRGDFFPLASGNGRLIDALWCKAKDASPDGRTVILFHANGCTLFDMQKRAKWYLDRNINVLAITIGGYPSVHGTPRDALPTELSLYEDACAAVEYLEKEKKLKKENMIAHGFSLGGVLASYLAAENRVDCVILEQAFTELGDVVENFLTNLKKKPISPVYAFSVRRLAIPAGRRIVKWMENIEKPVAPVGGAIYTDGYRNIDKIKKFHHPTKLAILGAPDDRLMSGSSKRCDLLFKKAIPDATHIEEPKGFKHGHSFCFPVPVNAEKAVAHFLGV